MAMELSKQTWEQSDFRALFKRIDVAKAHMEIKANSASITAKDMEVYRLVAISCEKFLKVYETL